MTKAYGILCSVIASGLVAALMISGCSTSAARYAGLHADSLNLDFEQVGKFGNPAGWYAGGGGSGNAGPRDYLGAIDPAVHKSGKYAG